MNPRLVPAGREGTYPRPGIARLPAAGFSDCLDGLADVLADAVDSGASVGFLAPFDRVAAARWWRGRAPAVAEGSLIVWVSGGPAGIDGTVSLALVPKPNARYRADLVKLMVHRRARGQGLGRALLGTAEREAARAGISLLLLDTQTGSDAEHLYQSGGWTRYGAVPGYAADPAGIPRDCSFFYKRLAVDRQSR